MNINFTLFMQAIAFFAFILFTAKFVWPPLMRAIDTRQKQIADGIAAGEEGRHSLASAEKRIADMVAEAKGRSSEIIAQGEKLKSETVDAAKAEAKAEADRILVAAKAEIAAGDRPREGIAARCGRGSRRRGRRQDPEARSRRESPRGPAGVDPARAVGRNAMAELTTIARPYAEAAFELARTSNALPVWSSMLRYASAVVADPAMAQALDNPKLTAGDKESLILSVCGDKLDAMGRRFVRVLVEADRVRCCRRSRRMFDDLQERHRRCCHGADRQRVSADRRTVRGTCGGARKALRQEDRSDGQRRPGARRRRADHRGRHGDRRFRAGAVAGDGESVAGLNPHYVRPAADAAG